MEVFEFTLASLYDIRKISSHAFSLPASRTACPLPPLNQRKQDQNFVINKRDELQKGDKRYPYNSAKQNSPPKKSSHSAKFCQDLIKTLELSILVLSSDGTN